MKRSITLLITVVLLFSCVKAKPRVSAEAPERTAIAIEYVAVPTLNVLSAPQPDAKLLTTYGLGETVSVLADKGEWVEVRTVEGSGWAKKSDLMTAEQAKSLEENPTPRFLTPPVPVPKPGARGEVALNAKVNTEGAVVQVDIAKNTTGNSDLALANANALMQARFYPMVKKGQRMTFIYEHKIYY